MFLRDFCIQRPVFATVINLFLLLGGLYALTSLSVRYLPRFDVPVVNVTTAFPGGSAALIERSVTTPIEKIVSQVDGIDYISSTSWSNSSSIQVMFKGGVDSIAAADAIRAKLNEVQNTLPSGAQSPVVQRVSLDSQPSLYLSFRDPNRDALAITDIVERQAKPILSRVQGVSSLQVIGERQYSVRIRLDRFQLASEGLTVDDVVVALRGQNVDLPGGEIVDGDRRISVIAETSLEHPSQLGTLVLRTGDIPIHLRDVAKIEIAPHSEDTSVRINGTEAVALGLLRSSDANPVDISHAVRKLLPDLRRALPPGLEVDIAYDQAVYIEASVDEVLETILITVSLVILVVLVFLGSFRSSSIASVAIPLSLAGGLTFLAVMGYSLNTFTLLAFVLVIGLVVDDAIVEVENVQRHVDAGMDPLAAGFKGSREIGFAVLAMTMTLAAVYAPIGLLPGMIGSMFREFGFTLAMTVVFSGFVAMTLSPMMCSRLLRPQGDSVIARTLDRFFSSLGERYRSALLFSLNHRGLVMVVVAVTVVAGFMAMGKLPAELAPAEDQGYMLVMYDGPKDASPKYMSQRAAEIERVLATIPERALTMTLVGMPSRNQGYIFVLLKPWSERRRTAMDIQPGLEQDLSVLPGVRVTLIDPNPLGGGGQASVQFVLKSSLDYSRLNQAIKPFLKKLREYQGITSVSTDLIMDTPIDTVSVSRERAAELGVNPSSIADVMGKVLGDEQISQFNWQGVLYPVTLSLDASGQPKEEKLEQIYLRSGSGEMVSLSGFTSIQSTVGASSYGHFDQQHSVIISANLAAGHTLSAVVKEIEALAAGELPVSVQTDWSGSVRQMKEANASMGVVFLLSFAFIFLVLAAQFESFRDPVVILSVAPLSIAGAGFALVLFGGSLNLYTGIGFVTLVGLIAKHGILITEFTNQLRAQGRTSQQALVEAATIRLRPILMTTAAMVLGTIPLALADGAGSVSRSNIGWVIGGGMLFGTLLSLFVIPTVYSLLASKNRTSLVEIPEHL